MGGGGESLHVGRVPALDACPAPCEQFPVVFLEPLDASNRLALGFDPSSEPRRRVAMERARDSGTAALYQWTVRVPVPATALSMTNSPIPWIVLGGVSTTLLLAGLAQAL